MKKREDVTEPSGDPILMANVLYATHNDATKVPICSYFDPIGRSKRNWLLNIVFAYSIFRRC